MINLKRLLNVIKEWYTTWISFGSLHGWLLTLSRLIAMVSSLILHDGGSGLRLTDGPDVKL